MKLTHFDAGVRHWLVQLTTLFGEDAAIQVGMINTNHMAKLQVFLRVTESGVALLSCVGAILVPRPHPSSLLQVQRV